MCEAAYNPNMAFKWNAVRVQLIPNQQDQPVELDRSLTGHIYSFNLFRHRWNNTALKNVDGLLQLMNDGIGHRKLFQLGAKLRQDVHRLLAGNFIIFLPARLTEPIGGKHFRSPPVRRRSPSPKRPAPSSIGNGERAKRERPSRSPSRNTGDTQSRRSSRSPPARRAKVAGRHVANLPKMSLDK